MRSPSWESSAGALATFLNSTTQCFMADLFTITLSGGAVLRYTSCDVPVTVNGNTFAVGPVIKRGKTKLTVGISVDTLELSLSADSTVTVNSVPLLQFIASGGLDGAAVLLERAFAATPPNAAPRRNLLTNTDALSSWSTYVEGTGAVSFDVVPDAIYGNVLRVTKTAGATSDRVGKNFGMSGLGGSSFIASSYARVNVAGTSAYAFYVDAQKSPSGLVTSAVVASGAIGAFQRYSGVGSGLLAGGGNFYFLLSGPVGSSVDYAMPQIENAAALTDYQPVGATYNAATPWIGTVGLFSGRVGPSKSSRYEAALTVNSDSELLNVMVPRNVYQPGCSNTLFDAACGLVKASFASSATASSATDATQRIFSSGLSQASGYFSQGWAVGVIGPNAGVGRTIKDFTGGVITTIQPWPSPVAAGNTFTVYPGCDKSQATCSAKFSNLAKFRGQPYVPAPETIT